MFDLLDSLRDEGAKSRWFEPSILQGRPGGVVEYQYTRKKIDKIPQNTPNSSKYTQK